MGFSFKENGPLDMRMDPSKGLTVAEWLTTVQEKVFAQIIWKYGQEPDSRRIARAIIQELPLLTTGQLVEAVTRAKSKNNKNNHPATRTFQALRIFIVQVMANRVLIACLYIEILLLLWQM